MAYQVVVLKGAERDLEGLSPSIRKTIVRRIHWLAQNAKQVIHHPLVGLPDDLSGLHKLRIGDYRALYWKSDVKRQIQVFRVRHRSIVYRKL